MDGPTVRTVDVIADVEGNYPSDGGVGELDRRVCLVPESVPAGPLCAARGQSSSQH